MTPADKSLNIVVPLDGSPEAEKALGCGQVLAAGFGGEFVVVATAEADRVYDDVRAYLDSVALPEHTHREVRSRLDATKAIDTVSRQWAPSLLCMSSRGRGGRTSAVLGSTTAELLSRGTAPIAVVGPGVEWDPDTHCDSLVIAVDETEESLIVVGPAEQIASAMEVPTRYVTVVRDADAVDATVERIRTRLTGLVDPSAPITGLVGHDVADALVEQLAAEPGSALAMATRGRPRREARPGQCRAVGDRARTVAGGGGSTPEIGEILARMDSRRVVTVIATTAVAVG